MNLAEQIWTVPDHHKQDSKRSPDNYKNHLNTYCQCMICTYKQTVSSNNRSMFVIHATARKLLKPEKKIKRNILPSVLYWGTKKKRATWTKNRKKELDSLTALWDLSKVWRMEKKQHITLDSTSHSISVLISPYLSSSHIGLHDLPGLHEYSILMESLLWVAKAHKPKFARLQVPYINVSLNYAREVWKNWRK